MFLTWNEWRNQPLTDFVSLQSESNADPWVCRNFDPHFCTSSSASPHCTFSVTATAIFDGATSSVWIGNGTWSTAPSRHIYLTHLQLLSSSIIKPSFVFSRNLPWSIRHDYFQIGLLLSEPERSLSPPFRTLHTYLCDPKLDVVDMERIRGILNLLPFPLNSIVMWPRASPAAPSYHLR